MKNPVITVKHFEIIFIDQLYKVETHSKDLALAILKGYFPEAESKDVIIDSVNSAYYQALDCKELTENGI